jgi:hypothetical protein
MAFSYCGIDVVNAFNLLLCTLILAVGCIGYARTKAKELFHIGVAFGLFAVSHVIAIFGVQRNFAVTTILIRIFAYLIVLFSLWGMRRKA